MELKRNVLIRKRRKTESWLKYIIALFHLWLGLLSSVIVFAACLSGAIYAFKLQIEDGINRKFLYNMGQSVSKPVSLDSLRGRFESSYGQATGLEVHSDLDRSVVITSAMRENAGVTAYFDRDTGAQLGVKNKSTIRFFAMVLDIHRFLMAGDVGKMINGVAILIMVFMLLSGLVMWFPKKRKHLKKSLSLRLSAGPFRINYDLHKVLGFYSSWLLLFIAITGLYVSFTWMKNAMIVGLGGESIIISDENTTLQDKLAASFSSSLMEIASDTIQEELSVETVFLRAESQLEKPGIMTISLPSETISSVHISHWSQDHPLDLYTVDRLEFSANGHLLKMLRFEDLPLHEQFKVLAKPLHTGEVMGVIGISIYFFVSLIGCSLPITGFVIWYKRSRKLLLAYP